MMKATHDMVWDWDLETNIIYRSEGGLRKVYGIANNESIRDINKWLSRIHPEDYDRVQKVIGDIMRAKEQDTFEVAQEPTTGPISIPSMA